MVNQNPKLFEETTKLVVNICNKINSYKPSESQLEILLKNRQELYYPNQNKKEEKNDNKNQEKDNRNMNTSINNNENNENVDKINSNSKLKNIIPKKQEKNDKKRAKEERYYNPKNYQGIDKFTNSNCNNTIRYRPKTFFFQ